MPKEESFTEYWSSMLKTLVPVSFISGCCAFVPLGPVLAIIVGWLVHIVLAIPILLIWTYFIYWVFGNYGDKYQKTLDKLEDWAIGTESDEAKQTEGEE